VDRLPLPLFAALLPVRVSVARCAALRERATEAGFTKTASAYPPGYRNNDRLVLDDETLAAEIAELPGLREVLAAHRTLLEETVGAGWTFAGINPRFRFCRYTNGQSFVRHRDGAYQRDEDERSFLTLQLYLDDDFVGGATRFFDGCGGAEQAETGRLLVSVVPERGRVIIFDHRLWHDGEAVFRGTKHVLRTDLLFRRTSSAARPAAAPYLFVVKRVWGGDREGQEYVLTGGRDGAVRVHAVRGSVPSTTAPSSAPATAVVFTGTPRSSVTVIVQGSAGALVFGRRDGCLFRCSMDQMLDESTRGATLGAPFATLPSAITSLCRAPQPGSDEVWVTTANDGLFSVRWDEAGPRLQPWTLRVAGGAPYEAGRAGWLWAATRSGPDSGFAVGDAGLFRLDARARVGTLARGSERSPTPLRALAVSPAGRLAVGDRAGFVHLDLETGRALSFRAHQGAIRGLVFEDEHVLTSVSEDTTLARFDLRRGSVASLLERHPHDDFVCSIEQLCDKSVISVGYDGKTRRFAPRGFTPHETSTKTDPTSWPQASKT
jgi:predicted 2-oxoglutarate/Fe(II)-dependent dioxygenase YbiX